MARKKRQKQSLKEFKAWLQGVEELQPNTWSPDVDQWHLIRDKILNIAEEEPIIVPAAAAVIPQPARYHPTQTHEIPLHGNMTAPPQVGGVPMSSVEMSDSAKRMLKSTADGPAKTPHIDTSDGNVNSSFA